MEQEKEDKEKLQEVDTLKEEGLIVQEDME